MNYQVYNLEGYRLHCIRSSKFKKTNVIINFKRKAKKQELTTRTLLSKILMESTKKFNNRRLMAIETENLYDLYLGSSSYLSGNYAVVSLEAIFLNDDYTEEGLFSKAIDFLLEVLMCPNVKKNSFTKEAFSLVKESLKEDIETFKDDPARYSYYRLFQEIDKKSVSSYSAIGDMKQLNKVTPNKLYRYYQDMIKNDQIDIFVISPLDKETVKQVFAGKLDLNNRKRLIDSHYVSYESYRKRAKVVREKQDYEQSKLLIGCKFDQLTPFEIKYVSLVYSYILGGGPSSMLFQTVREKNSLCYSISSSFKMLNQYLVISSGINPDSFKKCLKLIKKELKEIMKGNFADNKIEEAKVTFASSLKEIKDSPRAILNTYISHEYMDADFLEEREEKIQEVTKEDVIRFAKKVHIDTIYALEGGEEDE